MKKVILIVFCLMISFSAVYADETSDLDMFRYTEIKPLENPSEDDYTGVWIPFVEYLRPYKDVTRLRKSYQNDFVVIYDKEVLIKIVGRTFSDLPYKFEDGAVLSAIDVGDGDPSFITLRLLTRNYALYTIAWDNQVQLEFICYKKGYQLDPSNITQTNP